MKNYLILASLFVFTGCSLSPFTIVSTGQRGVVKHFGKIDGQVLPEGLHFKTPLFSSVDHISIQTQKTELTSEAPSKDLQPITSHVIVNWRVNADKVTTLVERTNDEDDFARLRLGPVVPEVFKAIMSKYTAEEIITKREQVATETLALLQSSVEAWGVTIEGISVVDLKFSDRFTHAIESKQIAEQESLQAEYVAKQATAQAKAAVNKARGEADALMIRAKAEADSNSLKQKTLTPQLIQYETIHKWNGVLPTMTSGAIPLINLTK